jgi:hypothetical protein
MVFASFSEDKAVNKYLPSRNIPTAQPARSLRRLDWDCGAGGIVLLTSVACR